MALLINPDDRALAQAQVREVLAAARNRGLKVHVLNAIARSLLSLILFLVCRRRVTCDLTKRQHRQNLVSTSRRPILFR